MRNKVHIALILIIAVFSTIAPFRLAFAIPTLSLDIGGGAYDLASESIITFDKDFSLYALLSPQSSSDVTALLANTYYLSTAITPKIGYGETGLGSFKFDGTTIDVTDDMIYGNPPIETISLHDGGDLAPHGVFPTYFIEQSFTFSALNKSSCYNSQDVPGGPTPSIAGSCYFAGFSVDWSGLSDGLNLHFDLYSESFKTKKGIDIDVDEFAPYSHDAQTQTAVPEPSTILLFGSGLLGLALYGRRRGKV